jgi:hypothetical protein
MRGFVISYDCLAIWAGVADKTFLTNREGAKEEKEERKRRKRSQKSIDAPSAMTLF